MAMTVVGLLDTPRAAESVVRELTSVCRCHPMDISQVMRQGDEDLQMPGHAGTAGSGALKGTGIGIVLGGIAGLAASATKFAVPGLDIVIAAGPVASALAGAGIGAAAGALLGSLVGMGGREQEQSYYAGMKRTGILITVHTRDDEQADCAAGIMKRHGGMEIDKRASDWRSQAWSGRAQEEPTLRPDPQAANDGLPSGNGGVHVRNYAPSTPAPAAAGAQNHSRPMEETTASAPTTPSTPTTANSQTTASAQATAARSLAAAVTAQKQAAAKVDTRNWITRKYTATYFGPERRTAANQNPYQGAERRQSA
jgi:hypothetical protein